jgi:hypothetical protein
VGTTRKKLHFERGQFRKKNVSQKVASTVDMYPSVPSDAQDFLVKEFIRELYGFCILTFTSDSGTQFPEDCYRRIRNHDSMVMAAHVAQLDAASLVFGVGAGVSSSRRGQGSWTTG